MDDFPLYACLYTLCFLFNLGTIFACIRQEKEMEDWPYGAQLFVSFAISLGLSTCLLLGCWFAWVQSDNGKHGWSLMPLEDEDGYE